MTRKVKISFLILVWSIVALQIFVNYQQSRQKQEQAVTAFSVVENDVVEEMITGYGYFGRMELSDDTKEQMLKNLADKLEISAPYDIHSSTGESYERLELIHGTEKMEVVLQLVSMGNVSEDENGGEEEAEQYILIRINTRDSVKQGKEYYDMVKRIYEEIGVKATVNFEVMMEQTGNLIVNAEETVDRLFDVLHASLVETINENGIYTVYGYRREEASYLMHKGEKTNVQLVMAYDEENDKTYIKVGIPMVNSSY
ncbi:MAG: YwmB family TATA-box binding protein [Lachnospiraceae bacterium]|nr:YwmB family TATA-box binding protein [Lachnospiraceae bacterium]